MSKNLLLIFTRNPKLGKVKTRLAKTVGDKTALNIYTFLLDKTKEVVKGLDCDKYIYYTEKILENDIWDENSFEKNIQKGNHLGEKMRYAFANGFAKGYEKIIIIGSDLYDLTPQHIHEAFDKLNNHDIVMGPALDGGYYLLGMKKVHQKIFVNKDWGTSSVRQETLKDLEKDSVFLLEVLNDIDVFEDIKDHPAFQKFLKPSQK